MISAHAAGPRKHGNRQRAAWLVSLAALVAVVLAGCTSQSSGHPEPPVTPGSNSTAAVQIHASGDAQTAKTTAPAGPVKTVHVTSLEGDGAKYGVGMPIVLRFTPAPTDSTEFTKAAKVTVNGQPADGAWYWEKPYKDQPIEAHYRPRTYWQANSTIKLELPIGGLSAGKGLVYSDKLTSVTFSIGEEHISTVNGQAERMTVRSNGTVVKTLKVSLGKATTRTYSGTKIVMQKGEAKPGGSGLRKDGAVQMIGNDPGDHYNLIVPWSVRITASGEYVHAASWNGGNIGIRSTSNGCTNLNVSDAKWFYKFSELGDVVKYVNTGGTLMSPTDGFGDWNVPWALWQQGGLLLNH